MNETPARRRNDASHFSSVALSALIVDDDPSYRAYVSALSRRLGFKVETACDGEEALTKLPAAFDLLVVDCEMPRLNGMRFMEEARSSGAIGHAYTVMLTAREDIQTKIAALTSGYDDFVTKGATEVEIVAKIVSARRMAARQRMLDLTVGELYGLTAVDGLTGVFNRKYFFDEAEKMLNDSDPVSVVLLDVDHLKDVNRSYGHAAGDGVLRDLGDLLTRSTRSDDILARYNGDEFAMLLPEAAPAEAEAIAQRLAERVGQLRWQAGEKTFGITVKTSFASSTMLEAPTLSKLMSAAER
jgi:diguanylate cyclase (GGDEF)-like protein